MSYKERDFICPDCHKPVRKRAKQGTVQRCTECGIKHSARSAIEMHNRSGPAFEKWIAGMAGAVHRQRVMSAMSDRPAEDDTGSG